MPAPLLGSITSVRRIVGGVVLASVCAPPVRFAVAAEPAAAAQPPAIAQTSEPPLAWRRVAFPATLVVGGLGLAAAVGFKLRADDRTKAFNENVNPLCGTQKPNYGGAPCASLMDEIDSADRWAKIGLGVAGASAVAALVLKLTEPTSETKVARRLTCAPGLGLSAACVVTF